MSDLMSDFFSHYKKELKKYKNKQKENIILFPYEIIPEYQPEIFFDLKKELPEFNFILTDDLSATDFYKFLSKAKLLFSASLTNEIDLISYKGAFVDCFPYVPDRNYYKIIFPYEVRYSNRLTDSFQNYELNKETIKIQIRSLMNMDQLALNAYCQNVVSDIEEYFNTINEKK